MSAMPVFLDARAICSRCGISISTLYRLCAKGVLPPSPYRCLVSLA